MLKLLINFNEVKDFPRDYKTMVAYRDKGVWFGEYQDGKLVGITNLDGKKIKSVYVLPEYRHRGIAYKLINEASQGIDGCYTLALDTSKSIFEKCGFKVIKKKEFKLGNVYTMRKE